MKKRYSSTRQNIVMEQMENNEKRKVKDNTISETMSCKLQTKEGKLQK